MKRVLIAVFSFVQIFAANPPAHLPESEFIYHPLFTGPLLTPETHVVQGGHVNLEPYVYVNTDYGNYTGNWSYSDTTDTQSVNPLLYTQIGLTSFMDMALTPQFFTYFSGGETTTGVGDFEVEFDFQLIAGGGFKQSPSLLFNIGEIFPVSKYSNLNPSKNGTDAIGSGTYQTTCGFVVGKNFDFGGRHFLATRYSISYSYSTPVHVKGFNTYGGGNGTDGYVYPGNAFVLLSGFEYSLTRNWVLAIDLQYQHIDRNRFSGVNGVLANGSEAINSAPSSESFSMAPAIEYNWSETWGLIAGCWFTIAGRNASAFASGIVAVNYYK